MLTLYIKQAESFDEEHNRFLRSDDIVIELEHSLLSVSKWESIHEKPYLSEDKKTHEETLDYVRCMILTPNVPQDLVYQMSQENLEDIIKYIQSKQTATWFTERGTKARSREIVTADLIYYWMMSYQIPFDRETWHLNKLMTVIRVASEKNSPNKNKRSKTEIANERHRINQKRKQQTGSKG